MSTRGSLKILYHYRTRSRDSQSVHIDEMIAALRKEGVTFEIVEPQRMDSLSFEPNDPKSLADAIRTLVTDDALCIRLGSAVAEQIRKEHASRARDARRAMSLIRSEQEQQC